MTNLRWHGIWNNQCQAVEAIKIHYGIRPGFDYVVGEKLLDCAEAAADHPEFTRALPQYVSKVQGMFTPEERDEHLARIIRWHLEHQEAAMEGDGLLLEPPAAAAERAWQFELVEESLTAPVFETS